MTASRRWRASAGLALCTLLVAACGGAALSSAPSAAPATPEPSAASTPTSAATSAATIAPASVEPTARASIATTGRIEIADPGFAVTLPEGWTRIDLNADDLDAILQAAGESSPEMAGLYSAQIQQLVQAGLVLFALGPDMETAANLNILSIPSGGVSLDLIEQVNKAQIDQLSDGDVNVERVTLPAGEAIHFRYTMPVQGRESPTIDQYLLMVDDRQLVVSLTSADEADARAIAESIDLLD
jgi:hypothetical protein